MAKKYDWTLDGIFLFGAPLKVFALEVQRETGGTPLSHYTLNLAIEDDPNLWTRLMEKIRSHEEFPRMILMEERAPGEKSVIPIKVFTFWHPWIASLMREIPGYHGPVLGIGFDKTQEHGTIIEKLNHHRIY
jgi:hypothetical protein